MIKEYRTRDSSVGVTSAKKLSFRGVLLSYKLNLSAEPFIIKLMYGGSVRDFLEEKTPVLTHAAD